MATFFLFKLISMNDFVSNTKYMIQILIQHLLV